MTEPTSVVAGDTIAWTETLADYPAPTWTLKYRIAKSGRAIEIVSTASGTNHAVAVTAATSAGWDPGEYQWTSYVVNGALRHTIGRGILEVKPDPAGAAYDPRTTAQVMFDNIEAYLIDPNNLAAASYSIGGRSLSRWSRAELLVERDKLRNEVRSETAAARIAAGLGNPRRMYTRFNRA